jgi:hypothetical protein
MVKEARTDADALLTWGHGRSSVYKMIIENHQRWRYREAAQVNPMRLTYLQVYALDTGISCVICLCLVG